MASVIRTALVPFSAQQMYDLINDIASYPEFMTGCVDSEVLKKGDESIDASLTLGLSGIQQTFTTRNTLVPPSKMTMSLLDGPFSHFEGVWTFDSQEDNACKVGLDLSFSFNNFLLSMTMGSVIEKVANQQVDALCERAKEIYG